MITLVVENEQKNFDVLKNLLHLYCPDITIIGQAVSIDSAIKAIEELQPALVFMDIELNDGLAFNVLKAFPNPQFQLIFTTAFEHYALKAIKYAAIDYLLKPINPEELQKSVQRAGDAKSISDLSKQVEMVLESIQKPTFQKLALPTLEGLQFVRLEDIVKMEADGSYTVFHMDNKDALLVSKPIKAYEQLLEDAHFMRIHNSWIINLHLVKKYVKGNGGYVVLEDGSTVDVSSRRKQEFLDRVKM